MTSILIDLPLRRRRRIRPLRNVAEFGSAADRCAELHMPNPDLAVLADIIAAYLRAHHPNAWREFVGLVQGQQRRDRLNRSVAAVLDDLLQKLTYRGI